MFANSFFVGKKYHPFIDLLSIVTVVLSKVCIFQNNKFCVLRLWIFYHLCLPFRLILPQKKHMRRVFFCSTLLHFQVGYLFFSLLNFPLINISHYHNSSFINFHVFFPVIYCGEMHIAFQSYEPQLT